MAPEDTPFATPGTVVGDFRRPIHFHSNGNLPWAVSGGNGKLGSPKQGIFRRFAVDAKFLSSV